MPWVRSHWRNPPGGKRGGCGCVGLVAILLVVAWASRCPDGVSTHSDVPPPSLPPALATRSAPDGPRRSDVSTQTTAESPALRAAPRAVARLRRLSQLLNAHADWQEVAVLYADEAAIYNFKCSPRCTRAQLEGWITAFHASGDRVEFTECRAVGTEGDDRLASCDGVLLHNGQRIQAHECFAWSSDGFITLRQNAPLPESLGGGCDKFADRVR